MLDEVEAHTIAEVLSSLIAPSFCVAGRKTLIQFNQQECKQYLQEIIFSKENSPSFWNFLILPPSQPPL